MSSTHQPKRTGLDEYQTPISAIQPLADFLEPYIYHGDTWMEPFRGDGNIVQVFRPYFNADANWCEIKQGRDYFEERPLGRVSWIITNPPFTRALGALEKSLREAEHVNYLLRLNFLGSQKRRPFWKRHAPGTLLVLSERPSFTKDGATDSTEYAWFIWSSRVPRGVFVA